MMIIKVMIKVLLLPLWVTITALWLGVKVIVSGYSLFRAFLGTGLILLMAGTIICYQDWVQAAFLGSLMGILFFVLVAGTFIEVVLDSMRKGIQDL